MSNEIVKTYTVPISGYVRGTTQVDVYFDPDTGERIDYEIVGTMTIIRDDTEIDTSELPDTLKEK